ncbi:MAG: hypothetical protein H6625_11180 [Bdellovibrionaceae bacterium]|nr:hypothetical protein [Pseudobdellovibrionaceae bacterium]
MVAPKIYKVIYWKNISKAMCFALLMFIQTLSFMAAATISGNSCENTTSYLQKKAKINITYIIGYKDARPARFVGDRYERNVVIYHLTQKCIDNNVLCGFERDKKDAYLFNKQWNGKKINLRIIHSSVSEDDEENRNHPFQSWMSQRAKKEFLLSLQQADILFYNGHSRAGGGPDFSPPIIKKDNQVDFAKYKNGYGSFSLILNYFKKIKKPLSVLGLFSCNATQHFEKDLSTKQKNVMLITAPHLIYFKEALDKSILAMDYLLRSDCASLSKLL